MKINEKMCCNCGFREERELSLSGFFPIGNGVDWCLLKNEITRSYFLCENWATSEQTRILSKGW